ncbi:MAG: apolipoprotein N-acyltransferase [Oleiphilaceae bacterium]|jgi:apolipoprotein N-acyltransferase
MSVLTKGLLAKLITPSCLIIAGIMQTLALAPFNYWILGPLSIALIILSTQAISNTSKQADGSYTLGLKSNRGFLHGVLFGLGLFGSGASWIYVSIHTYGNASPALATILTIAFVIFLSLQSSLVFWLHFKLITKSHLTNALLFLTLWILGDKFRAEFLTGFPWLFLGYSHLESPLAGWIPIIGVYGMTMLTVATGIIAALLLTQVPKKLKYGSLVLIGLCWLAGPIINQIEWSQKKDSELSVALVQLNIPQELKWLPEQRKKTLKSLEALTRKYWHNDLIVWPETAIPLLYNQAKPFLNKMSALADSHDSNIISGIPYRGPHADTGQTVVHNSITSIGNGSGLYHKQKLVPFGEYVPLQDILRGLIAFFDLPMSDFRKGSQDQALLKSQGFEVAPFICYEVVYPDFVATQSKHADYLLTISNDSWFGNSLGPLQHLEMAQMRAAENARYMIRATNNGISAIIDERGRIKASTEQFVETVLESKFQARSGRTPFSYTGSYPLFLLCFIYILWRLSKSIKLR